MKMSGELDRILNSTNLIKINKTLSYLSFTLKEMVNYTLQQTERGIPFYLLKDAMKKINKLKDSNEKLRIIE